MTIRFAAAIAAIAIGLVGGIVVGMAAGKRDSALAQHHSARQFGSAAPGNDGENVLAENR